MIELDCGTCPQLGRPRSHLGLVYAGTDQAGHDGNRFQTYDCLRRLTGSRRPPFRVLGHPEVGGIGVYMHENAASHVHDNTFEQCEASQKKKSSQERAPQSRRAPEEVLLAVLGAHTSLTPRGHARQVARQRGEVRCRNASTRTTLLVLDGTRRGSTAPRRASKNMCTRLEE